MHRFVFSTICIADTLLCNTFVPLHLKDLCDNEIYSAGFSSTIHVDGADKLNKEWQKYLSLKLEKLEGCDEGTLEKKLYDYFQKYLRTLGGSVYKSTVCGFTTVMCGGTESSSSSESAASKSSMTEAPASDTPTPLLTASHVAKTYYKQWFVGNHLGIAHNISSNQLEDELFAGVYGNSFLSGFEPHATSIPVYIDSEGRVHLEELESVPIPVAWGK